MVGLVLVSHSRELAEALIALVRQVSSAEIPIAGAAGVGDEGREFGTDAVDIAEAIQAVSQADGVVVLMDLGSAILSAEMALEFLPEELRQQVWFCAAPIVEGAIAAGVQIGLGRDPAAVCREAQQALHPKIEQLSETEQAVAAEPELQAAREITLTINNQYGLHARPAARFVQTAGRFDAEVLVGKLTDDQPTRRASAASLNSLAILGVVQGDQITVSASGPEADQALDALRRLVEDNFGEAPEESAALAQTLPTQEPAGEGTPRVIALSEGIAIGPVAQLQMTPVQIAETRIDDPEREWARLQDALATVRQAIQQRQQHIRATLGDARSAIFEAHLLILDDAALLQAARRQIFEERRSAAAAWNQGIQDIADSYRRLPDPYQQQRARDVLDVGNQVLRVLAGSAADAPTLAEPGIVVTDELTPSFIARLDKRQTLGLVAIKGGPTDHSAILARALGIPAVAIPGVQQETLRPGTILAIDGSTGEFWLDPASDLLRELEQRQADWIAQRERLAAASRQPAVTRDGQTISVAANAGSVLDAQIAVQNGAEGIGVLRTEFLYLTRQTPPAEAEQLDILRRIGETMGARPVYVRTLDVGGDKPLPYLETPAEANPFLGVRSIRLSLRHPELFLAQLRAILRAGAAFDVRVMFPMISKVSEIIRVNQQLEAAHEMLEREQIEHRWPAPTAMMIETPSAALLTSAFAHYTDYFSIGTNDLTQYTLAAERGNPELIEYADGLHPSILRLIQHVVEAAHEHGKAVGVCGELAGDPLAAPVLLGLGVDGLSMNPAGIPKIKALIRALDRPSAAALATTALHAEDTAAVRALAADFAAGACPELAWMEPTGEIV